MTREEIDIMWQQALQDSVRDGEMFTRYHFAKMITEQEREACAKVCDGLNFIDNGSPVGIRASNRHCAAAIRARSISRGEA